MSIGPIQLVGIAVLRSAAPIAYANPFNGGVLAWIGDPSNEWVVTSYVMLGVILCSAAWLLDGSMTFFECRFKTAALMAVAFVGGLVILAEGRKFDPMDYKELITASLCALALFSTFGRVFSKTGDQKEKE